MLSTKDVNVVDRLQRKTVERLQLSDKARRKALNLCKRSCRDAHGAIVR